MAHPKLAKAASGYGGRGYYDIFASKGSLPSVTTALGHLDKPGVTHWSTQQVAAYAAVNAEELLNRSEDRAYGYLQWYPTRLKQSDLDDPLFDFENAHNGVLDDLSDAGTFVHNWIEADLNDWIEPEIYRADHEQMVVAYLTWKADQDIEVICTESTVFAPTYAGTADVFWKVNGVHHLTDFKTSRKVRKEHVAQVAALSSADTRAVEVLKGTEGAYEYTRTRGGEKVTDYWLPDALPPVQAHSILQIRPDDYSEKGEFLPSFGKLHEIPQQLIEAGFKVFEGALAACVASTEYSRAEKQLGGWQW